MFYSSSYLLAENMVKKMGDLLRDHLLNTYLDQIKVSQGSAEMIKVCIGKMFWNKNVNYRKTGHFCLFLC